MSQVTTFYSYKGGSGRSMTLANVAWALATNGERVLVIDWDLEAPGLHRYFHPFLSDPDQSASTGLIDRVWDYVGQLTSDPSVRGRFKLADCEDIVQSLDLPDSGGGELHFIGAGRQDEDYSQKVGGLDWNSFYQRFDGEAFINAVMKWARSRYTHILIDSRTGVADTAGICTTQLPDALVFCLVYNRQSIEGTAAIARSIKDSRRQYKRSRLKMSFIPCRVEERSTVEDARRHAALKLLGVVDQGQARIERSLRRSEIRNYPWCAFEEKLAVFEELPETRGSLLDAMHDLACRIVGAERLQIKHVDQDVLSSYWRRAAFGDPRLFDLRALREHSGPDAGKQLQYWVDDALGRDDERPDWLMALAETAMDYASRRDPRVSMRASKTFVEKAAYLARAAYDAEPTSFAGRRAAVIEKMSGFLQRDGQLEEALNAVREAEYFWRQEKDPGSRVRLAQTMERRADIMDLLGGEDSKIEIYQEMASIYDSVSRRFLPVGSELEPARTQRLLALQYMECLNWGRAREAIERAVRLLHRTLPTAGERDIAEVIDILSTRLRIAVHTEPEDFDRVGHAVMIAANRLLPSDSAREKVIRELFLSQAELLSLQGYAHEALARIEALPKEERHSPRATLLMSEILIELGRESEAADLLIEGIETYDAQLTGEVLELLRRAFNSIGQGERIYDVLLLAIRKAGSLATPFAPILNRVLKKARIETGSQVSAEELAEFTALLRKMD